MRKKIKQLMNKEEGFTLVELLAVIAILGIILAIAIPSIGGVIESSKTKADAAQTELIEDAARLYDVENTVGSAGINISVLKTAGFLDLRDSDVTGTVKYDGGEYIFTAD